MTVSITSVNVNGVRAATKKRSEDNLGLVAWLEHARPDIVFMQEVRATAEQSTAALKPALDKGWHWYVAPAAAKGRAGVGILSRREISDIQVGFGSFTDSGRWLEGTYPADFGPLRLASLYLPSGAEGTPKQDEKYRFLDEFEDILHDRAARFTDMVIGGDWNICHRREDLKNWQGNRKTSGFLPDERRFMDSVFGTFPDSSSQTLATDEAAPEGAPTPAAGGPEPGVGGYAGAVEYAGQTIRRPAEDPQWFDVARHLSPEGPGPYTWWTYRGQAFVNDAGWRIDYQAATRSMLERAERSWVDKAESRDLRWSDHSPLTVVYG